jgi:hypothetical protein
MSTENKELNNMSNPDIYNIQDSLDSHPPVTRSISSYLEPDMSHGYSYNWFNPPYQPEYLEPYSTFYNVTETMYKKLLSYFESMPEDCIEIIKEDDYTIKGVFFGFDNNEVHFCCSIFSSQEHVFSSNGDDYILEIQRRSGDIITFNKLFKQIKSLMENKQSFEIPELPELPELSELPEVKEDSQFEQFHFSDLVCTLMNMIYGTHIESQKQAIRQFVNIMENTYVKNSTIDYVKLFFHIIGSQDYGVKRLGAILLLKLLSNNKYNSLGHNYGLINCVNLLSSKKSSSNEDPLVNNTQKLFQICDKRLKVISF